MQDNYIGDIGDYGKYGLLRVISLENLSMAVNWYKVASKTDIKQNDGKFTNYLSLPEVYRGYDSFLYDSLYKIVEIEKDRRIERIEEEQLFKASYFSNVITGNRWIWHYQALEKTKGVQVVFLDPDNGLESWKMFQTDKATEKHVKWNELKDYYDRGQDVILYQHRPQMMKKEECIKNIMSFQKYFLKADFVKILEFPKCTNRFYFMFIHKNSKIQFERICYSMVKKWGKNDFCREVILEQGDLV